MTGTTSTQRCDFSAVTRTVVCPRSRSNRGLSRFLARVQSQDFFALQCDDLAFAPFPSGKCTEERVSAWWSQFAPFPSGNCTGGESFSVVCTGCESEEIIMKGPASYSKVPDVVYFRAVLYRSIVIGPLCAAYFVLYPQVRRSVVDV